MLVLLSCALRAPGFDSRHPWRAIAGFVSSCPAILAGRSAACEPVARKRATSPEHAVGGDAGRRPVFELHAEREAALGEDFLDLGERLLAQVRGLEQLDLGLLDQVADVVDALGLEAVG